MVEKRYRVGARHEVERKQTSLAGVEMLGGGLELINM